MVNTFRAICVDKLQRIGPSWIGRFIQVASILFFTSLLFHSVEWSLLGIDRFEIKITMITFPLLLIAWIINLYSSPRSLSKEEKFFYALAFIYGASQFASLINSPYPAQSFSQGIIVALLMIIMIVIAWLVRDKKLMQTIYTAMGATSLVWGLYVFGIYQLFVDSISRLGARWTMLIPYWQGDPASFGDVLLFVTGPVYWIFFQLSEKKIGRYAIWILIPIWLHLFTLTYTKALILAGFSFFVVGIVLLRGNRRLIMAVSCVLFIILNIQFGSISGYEQRSIAGVRIAYEHITGTPLPRVAPPPEPAPTPPTPTPAPAPVEPPPSAPPPPEPAPTPAEAEEYQRQLLLTRFNPFTSYGSNSMLVRWKAIRVSIGGSLDHFFFGNGAGLSQVLLPKLADTFDSKLSEQERVQYEFDNLYGPKVNSSIIDAHNMFLTEFFNVGIIGALALVGLVLRVMKLQIDILRRKSYRHDTIYVLFLGVFVALLLYRMAGSYIVVPYFWVMLGVLFGFSEKVNRAPVTQEG